MFDFTPPHLHLLVNHFPVEGSIIVVLVLIFALVRRSAELKRLALIGFVLIGIAAYVSDFTGGGASREMRNVPGIQKELIKEHSKAADWAKDIAYIVAAFALTGLILAWRKPESVASSSDAATYIHNHKNPQNWVVIVCLIGGLLEVSTFAVTAYRGGLIRHPEIQSSFPLPAPSTSDSIRR